MNTKLLLKVKLPDTRIMYEDSWVLPLFNIVLKMYWKYLAPLHKDITAKFLPVIKSAYKSNKFPHVEGAKYSISLGYYRGRNSSGYKTKTIDIDALAYIKKVANDCLIKVTPIPDDCIFHVYESRLIYLGEKENEEIWLQVTRDEPDKKYKVVGFRYPDSKDWLDCIDTKTGGKCVVHKDSPDLVRENR